MRKMYKICLEFVLALLATDEIGKHTREKLWEFQGKSSPDVGEVWQFELRRCVITLADADDDNFVDELHPTRLYFAR